MVIVTVQRWQSMYVLVGALCPAAGVVTGVSAQQTLLHSIQK